MDLTNPSFKHIGGNGVTTEYPFALRVALVWKLPCKVFLKSLILDKQFISAHRLVSTLYLLNFFWEF